MQELNFTILDITPKSIIFIDETCYDNKPSNCLLEVKFPSSDIYSCQIIPKEVNLINTQLLGYTNCLIDFPDGVYEMSYSLSPNEFVKKTKKIIRFAKAKERLKNSLKDIDSNKELIKKLYDIDVFIQLAEAKIDIDCKSSMELFDLVQKEIKKIDC
ncbi:MAG: hypothetical protein ACRC5G_02710 [Cetobacterium sp.]